MIPSNSSKSHNTPMTILKSSIETIDAPFGAWPMDRYAPKSPPTKPTHSSTTALVDIIDDKAVKYIWEGDLEHELRMMLFAGPECAVQPLGRVFKAPERIQNGYIPKEKMIGFVMPLEKVLVSGWSSDNPGTRLELTREERREVIEKLIKCVERLHAKGIIHGDIKPPNILLCSDGEIRLCDWATASFEGDGFAHNISTVQYSSRHRLRYVSAYEPLTRSEDLYELGITIWEIWVGEVPFREIKADALEDYIIAGLRPDMDRIDDGEMRERIREYLDSAPPTHPNDVGQLYAGCSRRAVWSPGCRADPRHRVVKVVHAVSCNEINPERREACLDPFNLPAWFKGKVGMCPLCDEVGHHVLVEYKGE